MRHHEVDSTGQHYRDPLLDETLQPNDLDEGDRLAQLPTCGICTLPIDAGEAAALPVLAHCCSACEADILSASLATSAPPDHADLFLLEGAAVGTPPTWLKNWTLRAQSLLTAGARALRSTQGTRERLRARVESHRRAVEGKKAVRR